MPKVGIANKVLTEMSKIVFALAPMVLSGFVLFQSQSAFAQDTNVPKNNAECAQAVADAKAARENEPDIGPKAGKIFADVVELAEKRCEQKEFVYAAELLNLARGMVASE